METSSVFKYVLDVARSTKGLRLVVMLLNNYLKSVFSYHKK